MKVITELEYINARNTIKEYFAQQHRFTIDVLRKEAIKEANAEREQLDKEAENGILDIDPNILHARKMKELMMNGFQAVDKDKYINVIEETSVRVANCLCKYFKDKGVDIKWVDLKLFHVENLKLIKLGEIQESKNFGKKSKLVLFEMLKKYNKHFIITD